MKLRRSMKSKTSTKLTQKLTWQYMAAGVAVAGIVAVGLFIYLNLGTGEDSEAAPPDYYSIESGFWTDNPTWAGGVAPNVNVPNGTDIEIFYTVIQIDDLTWGANGELIITDTLVVNGDLHMGNNSDITINSGGVLVVTGNFSAQNKIVVGNGGIIAIGGNMTFSNSTQDTYNGSAGNLYVGGSVTGNIAANGDKASLSDLQGPHPTLFDIIDQGWSVLPVKLLYFRAKEQDKTVLTEWATAEEMNNDYFTVERSTDGQSFQAVGTVRGAGNHHGHQQYSYTDESPLAGTAYYRLKQTDYDGKFEYSAIVTVSLAFQSQQQQNTITLHAPSPNPFQQDFSVAFELATDGMVEVRLMNLRGNIVASEQVEGYAGRNQYNFSNAQHLPSDVYLLSIVQNHTTSKSIRVIKK